MDDLAVLNWIKESSDEMLEWVIEWAECNSSSDNFSGLEKMRAHLLKAFSTLGGEIEALSIGPSDEKKPAIRIQKRKTAPLRVLFCGHFDTVHIKESPFQTCSRIDHNTVRGPGVCDMKGGIAILKKTIEALEKSSFSSEIGWEILLTPDEEIGSKASRPLLKEATTRCEIGLIFEPSFPDGTIVSARKGSLTFLIQAKGKSAHAGRDFFLGKNALSALMHLALAAEKLTEMNGKITVNIGCLNGGDTANTVAANASCLINARMETEEDMEVVSTFLKDTAAKISEEKGVFLDVKQISSSPPKPFDERHRKLFDRLKKTGDAMGIPIDWRPSGGVCDGNFLASYGIPVIDTLGAVGGNMHTDEEYLMIDSLSTRSQLVFAFLRDLARGEKL